MTSRTRARAIFAALAGMAHVMGAMPTGTAAATTSDVFRFYPGMDMALLFLWIACCLIVTMVDTL